MSVATSASFKQVVELLVVVLIKNPFIDHVLLLLSESSWVNLKQLLVFSIAEVVLQVARNTFRFPKLHRKHDSVAIKSGFGSRYIKTSAFELPRFSFRDVIEVLEGIKNEMDHSL